MKLSDEKIQQIMENNCGNPPTREALEYHIWLNKSKLNFYTKNPLLKGQAHKDSLESYKKLIKAGEEALTLCK